MICVFCLKIAKENRTKGELKEGRLRLLKQNLSLGFLKMIS